MRIAIIVGLIGLTSAAGPPPYWSPQSPETRVAFASFGAEFYREKHNSYRGLTPRWLNRTLQMKLGVRVARATRTTYCLEATSRWRNAFQNGPRKPIMRGTCSNPAAGKVIPNPRADLSEAKANVRASIPAMEAYYADNNTYVGATPDVLRSRYDRGIKGIRIVRAEANTYCVQSTVGAKSAHKNGPAAEVREGRCPTNG